VKRNIILKCQDAGSIVQNPFFKVYILESALLFFGAFVFIQLVKLSAAKKY
jgi:hypothetical protein